MSANMSSAILRKDRSELRRLAEEHFEHDLTDLDKQVLISAASKLSTYTTIASAVGLGLATALAWRVRQNRVKLFDAFRATQKPTHVRFADGREEAIPDITPLVQPTRLGDVATYGFFGVAGLFLGGELGLLIGARSSRKAITENPDTRARVEAAYRNFKIDVLKKEIQDLQKGQGQLGW